MRAIEFAKWFINGGYDVPRNTLEGNMRLQKLLYFAQLIHLARYGKVLFSDPIHAFRNGLVIEDVRLRYKNDFLNLIREAQSSVFDFSHEEMATLKITVDIFGDCSVDELSRLNHLQHSWRTAFEASRNGNFHQKELAKIQIDDLMNDDLQNIRQVLNAYEMASVNDKYIEVNGVRYYYNSAEIEINENLISQLKAFPAKETAYSICCDESQGLIIY